MNKKTNIILVLLLIILIIAIIINKKIEEDYKVITENEASNTLDENTLSKLGEALINNILGGRLGLIIDDIMENKKTLNLKDEATGKEYYINKKRIDLDLPNLEDEIYMPIVIDENGEVLEELNEKIEKMVLDYFPEYYFNDTEEYNQYAEINFNTSHINKFIDKCRINDNILTLIFIGDFYEEKAAYPVEFLYGVNIDVETLEVLKFTDVVDENEIEQMKKDALEKASSVTVGWGLEEYKLEDYKWHINKWFENEQDYDKSFYFTNDKEVVITVNDIINALGDYSTVSFKGIKFFNK